MNQSYTILTFDASDEEPQTAGHVHTENAPEEKSTQPHDRLVNFQGVLEQDPVRVET